MVLVRFLWSHHALIGNTLTAGLVFERQKCKTYMSTASPLQYTPGKKKKKKTGENKLNLNVKGKLILHFEKWIIYCQINLIFFLSYFILASNDEAIKVCKNLGL